MADIHDNDRKVNSSNTHVDSETQTQPTATASDPTWEPVAKQNPSSTRKTPDVTRRLDVTSLDYRRRDATPPDDDTSHFGASFESSSHPPTSDSSLLRHDSPTTVAESTSPVRHRLSASTDSISLSLVNASFTSAFQTLPHSLSDDASTEPTPVRFHGGSSSNVSECEPRAASVGSSAQTLGNETSSVPCATLRETPVGTDCENDAKLLQKQQQNDAKLLQQQNDAKFKNEKSLDVRAATGSIEAKQTDIPAPFVRGAVTIDIVTTPSSPSPSRVTEVALKSRSIDSREGGGEELTRGSNSEEEVEDEAVEDDEEPDPRIQLELEKLNRATDAINSMETELENCRSYFRKLLNESTTLLLSMSKKMHESIEKSRPYYDARAATVLAQQETQQAATRFERANSFHAAAKEMVTLAETGLHEQGSGQFDSSWQETLNHATLKVNAAERERISTQDYHLASSKAYEASARIVKILEKDLKRSIAKSRPYFEAKAKFDQQLDEEKRRVVKLEGDVMEAKKSYAESLRNLEMISNEIHRRRRLEEERRQERRRLGKRGEGVGAEISLPVTARIETPSPSTISGNLTVGSVDG